MTGHAASAELTVEERKICQQSSKFQTFQLDFMDRCFDDTKMTSEENSINSGVVSCYDSLLHQADKMIQVAAVRKLETFLKGRILEPKVCQSTNTIFCLTNTICAGGGDGR
jgi:hypothetical protein